MASRAPSLILALILVLQWVGDVHPLHSCAIDCSHFWTLGEKADDPVNCHMYYICFDETTHSEFSFNCLDGEFFDTVSKQCKTSGYTCSPLCETCTFSCTPGILGKAANRIDCSSYYKCGVTVESLMCPPGEKYFDGNKCQTDESKCCSCKSECTSADAANHNMVPDYRNCTNFYLCLEPGIPDESTHGHCPSGNFDEMNGQCIDGAPCVAPCSHLPYKLKH